MRKNSAFKIWTYLIVILYPVFLIGQDLQFSFNQIPVDYNFKSPTNNYYVFHDSEGFIWISSTQGLNRYDGISVTPFLEDKNIQSMFFEDDKSNIWFSSYDAIYCYQRENNSFNQFHILDHKGEEIHENYQLLYVDSSANNLWVSVNKNLCIYNPVTNKHDSLNVKVSSIRSKLIEERDGFILLDPLKKGIRTSFFSKSENKLIRSKIILEDVRVTSIYFENKNSLWVGKGPGLIEFNLDKDIVSNSHEFDHNVIPLLNDIADAGNNTLIISTPRNGLFSVDKKRLKIIDQFYSYHNGNLTAFSTKIDRTYLDREDNLWISTDGKGVYFINLNKKKINRYISNNNSETNANSTIKAITENSAGQIFCLTGNDKIEIINLKEKNAFQIELPKSNSGNATPFHILCDHNDNIWYSSNYGLFVKKSSQKKFEKIYFPPSKVHADSPIFIFQLSDSTILISSFHSGILEVKEKKDNFILEKYSKLNITEETFTLIYEDSKEKLFLCYNQSSILIFDRDSNNLYHPLKPVLIDEYINGIIEDVKRDVFWIATNTGLYKLEYIQNDSFSLQKDTIVPINTVNGILLDSLNNLWLSSNSGLIRYNAHPNKDSIEIRHFSTADGLQSNVFLSWSALKTSKGNLAFGGVNGVNIFDPRKIDSLKIKPNPTITYIEINNEATPDYLVDTESEATNISQINKLVLKHNQNDLYLEIAALEYSDPSTNRYDFKMETGNGDTIKSTKNNTFQYPNMQPGTYHLTYNASNSDGIWFKGTEGHLEITIKHPWWKTTWAYLLYILIASGIVYAYSRYRISLIQKEEAFKREVAEYKQLAAETETAILRLQMNPHFIFNSMNSISSYIDKRDIGTANNYLNRFAKLMRKILKFAAKPFIIVSDEIELLEQYLQTESMRFEKKFTYSFELEDNFDPDDYKIPTMILQPFVENAIWHGLSNKEGEGKILLRFWEEENSLNCSIEDNGIGRKAAAKLKRKSSEYESKALSITNKRFELLEVKDGIKASYEILDLEDDQQNVTGTKVLLQFPIF